MACIVSYSVSKMAARVELRVGAGAAMRVSSPAPTRARMVQLRVADPSWGAAPPSRLPHMGDRARHWWLRAPCVCLGQ